MDVLSQQSEGEPSRKRFRFTIKAASLIVLGSLYSRLCSLNSGRTIRISGYPRRIFSFWPASVWRWANDAFWLGALPSSPRLSSRILSDPALPSLSF